MTSTILPPQSPVTSGAPGVLGEAGLLIRGLRDVLWAARDDGEKMETVAAIESLKSQLEAVELDVVRELDATRGAQALGWASTQDFVTAVSGGHHGCGPATVRLAHAFEQPVLAPVAEALADGWLSTAKAHVVERTVEHLPLGREIRTRAVQVLLDDAKRLDASELRKAGRRLIEVVDPEGEERRAEKAMSREERGAHLHRNLTITSDGLGGAVIRGRCTDETAALIKSGVMPFARPRPTTVPECEPSSCDIPGCGHDGRDPRDHGARMIDGLEEALRLLQGTDIAPESHGASPRVTVTLSYGDLRDGAGFGTTETGEDLPPQTVRRMACDADVIPIVLGGPSEVLDVGRHMRLASVAIWRALVARDHHCRFPGCTRPPLMCHAHHVVHWIDGGATSLQNLVLLCGHHHRLIHSGPWSISQSSPGEFRFDPPASVRRARGPRPERAPPDG